MPMLAVCPYCREGKVRAPENVIGTTLTCPICQIGFSVTVTDLVTDTDRVSAPAFEEAAVSAAPANAAAAPPAAPAVSAAAVTLAAQPAAAPPASAPSGARTTERDEAGPGREVDLGLVGGLIAITLAGVGMLLSQVPYGRFIAVAVGFIGLLLGLFGCLVADTGKRVPLAGSAVNGLLLLVTLFMPDWLGLTGWKPVPAPPEDDPRVVRAIGIDNNSVTPADWVNASKAVWQREDVRVGAGPVAYGPVELTGPNKQKVRTKEQYLQVWVNVRNIGVARKVDFRGWKVPPPRAADADPGADAGSPRAAGAFPQLTDPETNKTFPLKSFEAGWEAPGKPVPASLFPVRAAEQMFVFQTPAELPDRLHLELPGEAFGDSEPVRFVIPRSMVSNRVTR